MTDTMTTEPEEVTAGWLFATADALGLNSADLAHVLDVYQDTIRKRWKYGTDPIPDGVRGDLEEFVTFTDGCVDNIVQRAETIREPAVIVYSGLRDLPEGHMAATYGITWWNHVAFSARKRVPDLYIGYPHEVATAYDYPPASADDVYSDPSVIALYNTAPTRKRANRLA